MTVYLVGAGPGDPDLLTRRGARLLARAEIVIVDRLVDRRLLGEAPEGAVIIEVGKRGGDRAGSTEQTLINDLLVEHGRSGTEVVRLKGGDPFLFGRGAEEVAALRAAGVAYEVVPGISAALGVPALAGIAVTQRGVASTVTIASGRDVDGAFVAEAIPRAGTLVLLMAVANRAAIAATLMAVGRSGDTPVAVIESGATPQERRSLTTLRALGTHSVKAPAVLVIGEVASDLRLQVETGCSPST